MNQKKNSSKGLALPARMDLFPNSLVSMTIVVLNFPFSKEVQDFCNDIKQVLPKEKISFPSRQLNNGLLACSSTLTHGFEYIQTIDNLPQYQAMAVGNSQDILNNIPTPEDIHDLIFAWAKTWTKQYLKKDKGNYDQIKSVCDRFLDSINNIPNNWRWQFIQPETLIEDINSNNGLGYQAIPSLLATLLHEKTITIQLEDREHKITWRKVQGGGSNKTGLHLVSQPFRANYFDDKGKEKEGFFAYRLDFHLQTHAGRFNHEGHLKPWIFIHLRCQRYAHEPLVDMNYRRDVSILMGVNTARIDGYPVDSTLVKLTIENGNKDEKKWYKQLPQLLAEFKARNLVSPSEILNNPLQYGNLDNINDWCKDEYYIIHAEGYKYKEKGKQGKGHNHHIKTGFSFKEHANIINQILQLLDGVLTPDQPMECDMKTPTGKKLPLAMTDHELHRKPLRDFELKKLTEEQKKEIFQEKQTIIADAIQRNSNNKKIYLFVIYYEEDTRILAHQQLRQAFLLQEHEGFPEYITIKDVHISNSDLLNKIPVTDLPSKNKNFDDEIKNGHNKKRQAWKSFLQKNVLNQIQNPHSSTAFAIIEIGQTNVKGIHPKQHIRSAVREACVLNNINSQMIQTVKPVKQENPEDETKYSKATQGRVLNALLDITLRQTATLYGLPLEIYQVAKIPENIAKNLDVIAFCRIKKNNFMGKNVFQYAIVVRLSATGKVDVLLPNEKQWIPYTEASIRIGKLFDQVRNGNRKELNQVQMKGGDLVKFVADTLTNHLENPTIALIEADVWRNEKSREGKNNKAWFQLKNEYLLAQKDILNFNHVPEHFCEYQRDNEKLNNLLAVIRLRNGEETPQYVSNRQTWDESTSSIDFTQLSGFIDNTIPELLHYFSIGRIPDTQKKKQHTIKARELSKIEHQNDIYAVDIPFKHQQMIEMLPLFIHQDFQTDENIKALCRVAHYLRTSPAYTKGNVSHPYPMHLGTKLMEDMLCILSLDD